MNIIITINIITQEFLKRKTKNKNEDSFCLVLFKKKYQTKYKKNTHFNTTKIKAEYFL